MTLRVSDSWPEPSFDVIEDNGEVVATLHAVDRGLLILSPFFKKKEGTLKIVSRDGPLSSVVVQLK